MRSKNEFEIAYADQIGRMDGLVTEYRARHPHCTPWAIDIGDAISEVKGRNSIEATNRIQNQVFSGLLALMDWKKSDNRVPAFEYPYKLENGERPDPTCEVKYAASGRSYTAHFHRNADPLFVAQKFVSDGLPYEEAKALIADARRRQPINCSSKWRVFDAVRAEENRSNPDFESYYFDLPTKRFKLAKWRYYPPEKNGQCDKPSALLFSIMRTYLAVCPTKEMLEEVIALQKLWVSSGRDGDFFSPSLIVGSLKDGRAGLSFVKFSLLDLLKIRGCAPAIFEYARYGQATDRLLKWVFLTDNFLNHFVAVWQKNSLGTPVALWMTSDGIDSEFILHHRPNYVSGKLCDEDKKKTAEIPARMMASTVGKSTLDLNVPNYIRLANHHEKAIDGFETRILGSVFREIHKALIDSYPQALSAHKLCTFLSARTNGGRDLFLVSPKNPIGPQHVMYDLPLSKGLAFSNLSFSRYSDDPSTHKIVQDMQSRELTASEIAILQEDISKMVPKYRPRVDLIDWAMRWAMAGDPLPFEIDWYLEIKGLPDEKRQKLIDMRNDAFYWQEPEWVVESGADRK